jgi:hypothetical protein
VNGIIAKLQAWAAAHKDDDDGFVLNTFLTVGELRKIIAALQGSPN